MQNSVKKIGITVLLILLLPIVVFFIYQFSSLNKSEEEIKNIYEQQLETILFSINQYSEDIVSSWRSELQKFTNQEDGIYLDEIFEENKSIKTIFTVDSNLIGMSQYHNKFGKNLINIEQLINERKQEILNLNDYLTVGYQKIEALGKIPSTELYVTIFAFKNKLGELKYCGIVFQASEFVKRNLVAKIAQACGEKFILAVIDIDNIIHSCGKAEVEEFNLRKEFWIVPGFQLAIKMKNNSIEELIKQRYYENIIILGALLLILLIGIIIIFKNLQKEYRLAQIKSDFVSNVSHELRTPLSLISMYSETLVLNRLKSEKKKKEYYEVINSETNRLSKIVNSILNFSKMESGTRKYNFIKVDLVQINNELLETYDYHIVSKGFEYKVEIENGEEEIFADHDAITESMINLIENAMKYSPNKKVFEIQIGSNNIGPYWEIKDYGIGVSDQDKRKIFEKFYRVSSGLVHNTKGTGLGLSLVKQIMNAHNGDVVVYSSLGEGSKFSLQFNKEFKIK